MIDTTFASSEIFLYDIPENITKLDFEHEAVVWVLRSDWERVTEREELVGRFSLGSRLPQYLGQSVFSNYSCGQEGE